MASTIVQRLLVVAIVVLATAVTPGECIVDTDIPTTFYPFGPDEGDTVGPIQDDGFAPAISIPGGFRFFGSNKNVLFVNLNGAFTFDVAFGGYTPTAFPITSYSVVAPYWGDVDVRKNDGRLYYRSETGTDILTRASNDVRATFSSQCLDTFSATWVFIATWYDVTYYGGSTTTPINSFQGVLVTDGTRTFAIFNYGTLTWTTGTASGGNAATGLGGIAAQVGFNSGDGSNFYVVPDSRTNAIVNIYQQTNVGVPSRWMFRIDVAQIGPAGCVLNPTTCTLNPASGLCAGTGTCSFQGDSHYLTFDGKRFDYQGICKYLVAKPRVRPRPGVTGSLPYFEVYARGEFRYGQTTVAYARYAEIAYGSDIIRLSRIGSTWNALQYGVISVTVNGVAVTTPRCSCGNDYSIYQIGFFMRFITTWGLVVEYDGFSQVNVNIPPIYNGGKLTGICGNFDGLVSNDATECNGTSYTGSNVDLFGDKCVISDPDPDHGTSCPAPPAPTSPCLTTPPQNYVNRCGQLSSTTGPFASCIARLNALVAGTSTWLYNDCILDACLSSGAAICNNVWSLVDLCANLGIQVDCNAWQTLTNCPVTCPAGSGMVFQCNPTTVCHPTCNNPIVSATCTRPNKAACVCPAGTLLDNGVCVQTCLGGCVDTTGAFRQAGETWSGPNCQLLTCQACPTCSSTFQVVSSNGCESNQVCFESQCVTPPTAVCWCSGDPHCSTFDSLAFIDYQGTCEYLLAGVIATSSATNFQVYSQSDHYFSPNNPAVAYVSRVRVVIGSNEVILERDFSTPWVPVRLTVNGVQRSIPYDLAPTYAVTYAGLSVRIQTTFEVSVEYDGWTRVAVIVPSAYGSQLTGLCGNYDGNSTNDWTTADGTNVADNSNRISLLGDSFIVGSTEGCCNLPLPVPSPTTCPQYSAINTLCTNSIRALTACVSALGTTIVNEFITACILDGCVAVQSTTTTASLAACMFISQFYEQCSLEGVTVNCTTWQRAGCAAVFADPSNGRCPTGLTYQCDAPACTATCDNPTAGDTCTLPNRESCVCPTGELFSEGTCYATCPTGCLDGEILRPFNSTWIDPTTCATKRCVACATCYQGSDIITTPCNGVCASGTCVTAYSVCTASGDPHYTTFDNVYFTYQGLCKYLVSGVVDQTLPAGFQNFQIFARNERRTGWSPLVTFVKYVEVVFEGDVSYTVRLSRSPAQVLSGAAIPVDLTVSGDPFSIPFGGNQYPFKVYYSGSTVRFQSNFGVIVEFDGFWTLTVFVPQTQYFGITQGICGNNDGQANNDWTLLSGANVQGNANAANLLGDSFIVTDTEVGSCPTTPAPVPVPCSPPPAATVRGCSPITNITGPFANCINDIGRPAALTVYNTCLFDACYSNGTSIITSVQTFAQFCDNQGTPVPCETYRLTPWAAACPIGMTFQCGTTSCPATCAELDAPRTCLTPPIDACACPNGQYFHEGRCVATCPAGCVDENTMQFYTVGTWWRGTFCTVYTCVSEGNIQTSSCLSDERCSELNTCVKDVSICYCQGDPHCATYDNRFFDYQGICRYLMSGVQQNAPVSLPKFEIYSKNEYRYGVTSVAWVKYVEIQLDGGDTIRLVGDFQALSYIAVTTLVNFNLVYPPYIGTGYTIDLSGPTVVFRTSFGVQVSFDGRWTLSVTVPNTPYSGQLRGLCGNNDGNSVNDFTLFDGTDVNGIPNGANLLGDSFVVPDAGNTGSCPAPPPPSPCGPTTPLYSTFVTRCNVLKNPAGPFGAFIALIGAAQAEIIYNGCILDACFTNGTSICPNIKSFIDLINIGPVSINVDSCSVLQITQCDSIIRRCPTGMTYQCNAPGCPATCTNPNPSCILPNWDSCVCPPGTLLHNGQCVSTCPRGCVDDALQLRPIGAVWRGTGCLTYTCTACVNCALGAQIVVANCLQGELCSQNNCVPPNATCSCDGDPHCATFDSLRFDYQGTCKYNLVSVKTQIVGRPFFQVYARNELRYGQTSVAYVKYVEIIYGEDTVRLTGNYLSSDPVPVYVSLNGFPISVVNPYNGAGYVVSNYGSSVRFGVPSIGLVVIFNTWGVYVTVPNSFVSKLTGLCGNFDGSSANDFTTAAGVDVSAQPVPANIVGDSFVIQDPELPGGTQQCVTPAPPTPCIPTAAVVTKCSFLNDSTNVLFGQCIIALGQSATGFLYDACILDACNTNGASVCFSIRSFIDTCNQLGFPIACDTWQVATGCGTVFNTCPVGMIYQCSTSGCQPTCENPTANRNCALPATSGCVCPTGQLLLNGVCTSVCPRGCVDINGQVRPSGATWQIGNCQTATCVACPTCLPQFRIQVTGNCCGTQRCVNNACV